MRYLPHELRHTIGCDDPHKAILTTEEFTSRPHMMRGYTMSHEAYERGPLDSVIGPMIGIRRPRYEVLAETLGSFLQNNVPEGGHVSFFINLGSTLRQLFSEYSAEKLTAGETRQHPYVMAAELINLAGHYRHYAWSRYGARSTVAFYHSTVRCQEKIASAGSYKGAYYSKRVDVPQGPMALVRRYSDTNLKMAQQVLRRIPDMYLVDTGAIDPEAWPWAVMQSGAVSSPSVVISGWESDAQYALAQDMIPEMSMHPVALLRAQGDGTRIVSRETLVPFLLRDSKQGADLASGLSPGHALYMLALSGDKDLGVEGLPKVGPAKAAKLIGAASRSGKLPPDHPSLTSLLEEAGLAGEQGQAASSAWSCLVHADYARAHATPSAMALTMAQLEDLSGLLELERANSKYFSDTPINLDMAFAGEEF